ncbi:hypothetical protein N5C39_25115, partial [Enterobacter bugandensis]
MKDKDFRVELRDVSTPEKHGHCKVTIYNDGESTINSPTILIDTNKPHWHITGKNNFAVTSGLSSTIISGGFADKKTIPPKGHQEFSITCEPAITKNSYPKNIYLGFKFGHAESDSFSAKTEWEKNQKLVQSML